MERFWRIVKWLLLGGSLLLALAAVTLVIYTRSEHFTGWLRQEGVAVVNNMIRGSIKVERLEGSVWRDVTLHNVALSYENAEILTIPRVEIVFSLWRLLWGELQISRIDALRARANLHQDRDGRWNVVEALGPREPQPEQSSKFTTVIRSLRLRDGGVDLRLANQEGKLYRLQSLDLEGGLGILPDGVSLELRELGAGLVSKSLPELRLKGALDYRQMAAAPATVKVKEFWAASANSRVKINGDIAHRDTTTLKARLSLEKLAAADIAYFVPDWPLKPDLSGTAVIEGALDDLTADVNLTGAGAKLAGKFRVDTQAEPLAYSAAMRVSGLDVRQWSGSEEVAGVLSGTVDAQGRGFALPGVVANTRLEVRGAEVEKWMLGTVSTDAKLEDGIVVLDGSLQGNLGSAKWSGKIGLKEKNPTYDLALKFKDVALERAVPDAANTKGKLNLEGTVKGAGIRLADAKARAELRILPSSLGAVSVEKGFFDVSLRDNKISIARATLNAADSLLEATGELGLDAKATGRLDYRFRAGDVAPWLALVDQKGSGSITVTGKAQGNLADLQTQGAARFAGLRLEPAVVRSGDVQFALRASKDRVFPEGVVTFRLAGVDAGMALRRLDGRATLSRAPAQAIQLEVSAQDNADRKHGLSGLVNFSPGVIAARFSQISLSAPDGVWKLARPATLTMREQNFFVDPISLRNGDREISLQGRWGFAGSQDLRVRVDRLPLETLAAFKTDLPKMSGIVGMTAQIGGTAAAPELTVNLQLADPVIAGQAYAGAQADGQYRDRKTTLRLLVRQDATHSLTASGTVPLILSWNDKFRAETPPGMDLRLQSEGVNIAFLNAFTKKTAENIAGEIALDVAARGSLKQPELRGTFRLRDGKLKIVPLNVDVHALTMNGDLDSRNLNIREISAKAKEGEIRGSGSLALKEFDISAVKLSLNAQRWPAIDTAQYQVRVAGKVDVQGSVTAPAVTGQVVITDGLLRPDLTFLEQSKAPTKRDETIVVIRNNGVGGQTNRESNNGAGAKEESDVFKNLTLDLAMRAPGNLWVRHPDMIDELSGNVKLSKARGRDLDLAGRVEAVRGSFTFQGRRFQLVRGVVEFTGGGKINPILDIAAQYKLPNYQVEVVIAGSAEKPTLTLTSQPPLEQADILALIVFGKPINNLNQSEQSSLQGSAVNLASGFVASRVANSVAKALGLDALGLDVGEVGFGGGRVGIGRYLGKTYVSASQELSGEHGQQVSLEYEIAPDWKIGTSATSTGSSGIDIIWHKRY
jgi:autotransporter translocation and assembly factor TamB